VGRADHIEWNHRPVKEPLHPTCCTGSPRRLSENWINQNLKRGQRKVMTLR
jgi:hypothetical protein